MKVLVCGGRNYGNRERIRDVLSKLPPDTTIIHGDARGADTIAGEEAHALGFEVIAVPAQWRVHGRAAGPIRNRVMLAMNPSRVLAFHDDILNSKGTRDCVLEARRRGIPVELHR